MSTKRSLLAGLGVLTIVAAAGWIFAHHKRSNPPVLLITIDTLRADALSILGGPANTPEIDRLAREGVLFEQAATAAPLTGPSHTSILSGLFPYHHGIRDNGQILPTELLGLAQWLHAAGYRTAGFVSGFPLHRQFGFDHGFDHYDDNFAAAGRNNPFALRERRAEDTVHAALGWLSAKPASKWFMWVHLYDPHTPYSAPTDYHYDGPRGPYYAEVAYTDHWVGELVRSVRARFPEAIVVISSDHGEGLGDHGEFDHGLMLYQSTVRVPVVFNAPDSLPPQRLTTPARTVDIAPTILGLTGVSTEASLDGVDLAPTLRAGKEPTLPPAYSESYFGAVTYGWAPLRALREKDWKRIEGARSEVFDLATDAQEAAARADAVAMSQSARLESLLAGLPEPKPPTANDVASANAIARLRSLGYLGAGTPLEAARWRKDVDPRDRLAEHAQVLQAQEALDQARWRDAEAQLRAILQEKPDNRVAWLRLGSLLVAQHRTNEGLTSLRRAVELDPENPETRYRFAEALMQAHQFVEAATQWSEVTRRQPGRAVAWSNLGASLLFSGRKDDAVAALEQAVALAPEAGNLRENLARTQLQAGRATAAIATLEAQAGIEKEKFQLSALLALQLADAGKREQAQQWLAHARPGQESWPEANLSLAAAFLRDDRRRAAEFLRQALSAKPAMQDAVAADPDLAALLTEP